jgi:site-specific DNA recombinase
MDKRVKVAIYARVSTQEQAFEGTSLDHQVEQMEAYCRVQDWQIAGKYIDPGYSGRDDNRPALRRLLTEAKLGMFQKVLVFKLDRLTRKLRLLLEIEEKLKDYGVSLNSLKETLDTSTAMGKTVFQMFGLVSEWERDTFIERSKSGRIQRYREGCWGPGKPPFGYIYDRDKTKKLVINEEQANVIRRIYDEYAKGKSMWGIANLLNSERIPPRRGGKGWRNTSVRDVLFDPVYKGTQIVNVYKSSKSLPEELPETAIKIQVPPIVDEAIWSIAQERRKNNKRLHPPRNDVWLLQGLITCGECGYGFRTEVAHHKRQYGCRGRLKYTHIDESPRCTSPRPDAEWLEKEVWQRIEEVINDPNRLEKLIDETIDSLRERESDLSARIRPIEQRLSEIHQQKAKLAEEWVMSSLKPDRVNDLKQNLDQEESRLRSIRSEIDPSQLEELERTSAMLKFWEGQLKHLEWDTETEDGKKVRLVDKPHKTVLNIVGLDDKESSGIFHFPATRRGVLDLLQVKVIVFMDRVEIKSVFPVEAINCQELRPDSR